MAAKSGFSGDQPLAIKSALTKWITPSSGRYRAAKVVLTAPLGPAMTMHRVFVAGSRTARSANSFVPWCEARSEVDRRIDGPRVAA